MHKDNLHLSSLLKGEQRASDDSHPSMGSSVLSGDSKSRNRVPVQLQPQGD